MNTRKSRSSPKLRLILLLAGLASLNLANYETEQEPSCNCSQYQGRMQISPGYLSIEEGRTGFVRASFPEDVQWSISLSPSPDVVAEFSGVEEPSGLYRVDVSTVQTVVNPDAIDFHIQRPARRTHLEIMARPETSPIERRLVTVLALTPMISGSFPMEIFGDPALPSQDFELSWQVRVETERGDWSFEFDVSGAPSLRAPSSVVRLSSNAVAVELPYADTIRWTGFTLGTPLCIAAEPVHVTATSEDRVLRSTVAAHIFGYPERFNILNCPQPSDFRE